MLDLNFRRLSKFEKVYSNWKVPSSKDKTVYEVARTGIFASL